VARGIANLEQHCENVRQVGLEPIVAINKFPTDSAEEIAVLSDCCARLGVQFALSDVWAQGGAGGAELARLVLHAAEAPLTFAPAYPLEMTLQEKVTMVAQKFYGADGATFLPAAEKKLRELTALGFGNLPVCIAKTQNSLSDDAKAYGRPRAFKITVRDAKVCAGAGFVVIYAGNIMTMPGLPKIPAATKIGMKPDGEIYGLF
jgi:formate--tetrahydrofolate ligase